MSITYQMRACPSCGKPIIANAKACMNCGASFVGTQPNAVAMGPRKRSHAAIGFICLCILFFMCATAWHAGLDGKQITDTDGSQHRATASDVQIGMTTDEVHDMLGQPDHTQEMHNMYGSTYMMYYDGWQFEIEHGRVVSRNRY